MFDIRHTVLFFNLTLDTNLLMYFTFQGSSDQIIELQRMSTKWKYTFQLRSL